MIALPAIDLREGACVQLVGGDFAEERVRLADPVAVAQRWIALGFTRLHVVDLDAAIGRGSNRGVIGSLLTRTTVELQVGGGVRDAETVEVLLDAGAFRVVVGTRAVEELDWLTAIATRHPGRIVLAADVRGRQVVMRGWVAASGYDLMDLVDEVAPLPLAGLLVTAVEREGRMGGPDVDLVREVAGRMPLPVIASGGIATMHDLRRLQEAGAAEAVLGMALYTGALDGRAVAEEFGR